MNATISARQYEITGTFLAEIDKHLSDLVSGKVTEMFEISEIAEIMHIHPRHLSNTVKQTTGKSACMFFEEKIIAISKKMLEENKMSIAEVARQLTYDPSNFTKFFKRYTGQTPKVYRETFFRATSIRWAEDIAS